MKLPSEKTAWLAAEFVKQQRHRELLTCGGFCVTLVGVAGNCGVWWALIIGGGIVFALGLYGLHRK